MTKSPKAALLKRPRRADTTAQPTSSPSSQTSTETGHLPQHPHPTQAASQAASKGAFILPTESDDLSSDALRVRVPPGAVLDDLDRLTLHQIDSVRALCATARYIALSDPRDETWSPRQAYIPIVEEAERNLGPIARSLEARFAAQVRDQSDD
jgi:hypothetical protein